LTGSETICEVRKSEMIYFIKGALTKTFVFNLKLRMFSQSLQKSRFTAPDVSFDVNLYNKIEKTYLFIYIDRDDGGNKKISNLPILFYNPDARSRW